MAVTTKLPLLMLVSGMGSASTLALVAVLALLLVAASILSYRRAMDLRVPARLDSIALLYARFEQLARRANLKDQTVFHCRLALDEACANIIEHAYHNRASGHIDASIQLREDCCVIHLIDYGEPYDPALIQSPDHSQPIEAIRPGGLGLHLMRSVMDEVKYTPGAQGNRLEMRKRV